MPSLLALKNTMQCTRFKKSPSLWLLQVWALINKEFQQILRDPSSLMVAVILPLIFLLLFGYGISLDPGVLKLAITQTGQEETSQSIAATFAGSPWFQTVTPKDIPAAEKLMRDSQIQGILVFKENFDEQAAAGRRADVQLLIDGSEPNTARFIQIYSQGVLADWQASHNPGGKDQADPIALENRFWFNATAKSEYFLVPGSITVIMTLIGTLLTSLVFAREYERGTMETLLTTPVSRMQIMLGKLAPYYCMGMLGMAFCVAFALLIFRVPFRGSFSALVLLSSVFLLAALGQGLLISIILKKQLIAAEAGLYSGFLPSLLLSGFVFDIPSMPYPMQLLTKLLPATYFNTALRTIFLAGDIWTIFCPCICAMLTIAAFFLALVYKKLTRNMG